MVSADYIDCEVDIDDAQACMLIESGSVINITDALEAADLFLPLLEKIEWLEIAKDNLDELNQDLYDL